MKKIIISILIVSTSFMFIKFDNSYNIYAEILLNQPKKIEETYLNELTKIRDQIYILSSNSLKAVINKQDKTSLFKESTFINSQIRNLRIQLSEYHKTESGNIEKNPLALAFLNTLNYYIMSLSYLLCFLNTDSSSEENKSLQSYYFSKASGDQTLLWVKSQIK